MKKHPDEMLMAGFTIDRHVYPWFAYKGERMRPTESHVCYTDDESMLRREYPKPWYVMYRDEALAAVRAVNFTESEGKATDDQCKLRMILVRFFSLTESEIHDGW